MINKLPLKPFCKSLGLLASLCIAIWPPQALAKSGAFVEPYVGLSKLELDFELTRYGTFKDISNGFFLGMKGGYYFTDKFFAGLDYHSAGPYNFDEQINEAEWNLVLKGVGIGADYKVIRFWVGYYFDVEAEDDTNQITYTGSATKVGFGLEMSKKLRANLDLLFYDINKESIYGTVTDVDGIGLHSTQVSISIPLDI